MTYTLQLTEQQLALLNAAVVELPFKVAAPLVQAISRQLEEQKDQQDEPAADHES